MHNSAQLLDPLLLHEIVTRHLVLELQLCHAADVLLLLLQACNFHLASRCEHFCLMRSIYKLQLCFQMICLKLILDLCGILL